MTELQRMILANAHVPEPTHGCMPDVHERAGKGPPTQLAYEEILTALAYVRMRKVQGYGESRYQPESARYNLALAYGDMERKLIRLKHAIFGPDPLTAEVLEERVMDGAADLANYGVMMVQVCATLLQEGKHE